MVSGGHEDQQDGLRAHTSNLSLSLPGISTEPAAVAYERVLAEAGAPEDEVDARIAGDVLFGPGRIIDSQEQVGVADDAL